MPALFQDLRPPLSIRDLPVVPEPAPSPRPRVGRSRIIIGHQQFEFDWRAPHAKPLYLVPEVASALACSINQVYNLVDSGVLHAVSISDAESRLHRIRITRLSVLHRTSRKPAPTLAQYTRQGPDHWCIPTAKQVLRPDELTTYWRVCVNQVRALLPEISRFTISADETGQRQHWRVRRDAAQAFIDQRLIARNFTPSNPIPATSPL